jgi:hypothetical protein
VRVGGARPPPLITFTLTSKVAVYAPAEWADTLTLFHLYQYMYSVRLTLYSVHCTYSVHACDYLWCSPIPVLGLFVTTNEMFMLGVEMTQVKSFPAMQYVSSKKIYMKRDFAVGFYQSL